MSEFLYDGEPREKWLNGLRETDDYNVRHLLTIFARLGIPKSYLDVGCGTGAMVKAARQLGVEAFGVDQLVEPDWPSYFYHANLVDYFELPEPVEMITSIEVAEHLHGSAHATFCDTLNNNLKPGGFLLFSAARPGQGGTGHIACVIEGTQVSASMPRMASRRLYNGEIVTIVTRSGNKLSITPNHPILTEIGWVKAGFLHKGDNLVCGELAKRESFDVMPDYDERPTRIEQIFGSLCKLRHSLRLSVPLSPKDFHGDVIVDGDVDIVYAKRLAQASIQSSFLEPLPHYAVEHGYSTPCQFHGLGSLNKTSFGVFPPKPRPVGVFGKRNSFLGSHSGETQFSSVGHGSDFNPSPFYSSGDATIRNSKTGCNLNSGFPSAITLNDFGGVFETGKGFGLISDMNSVLDKDASGGSEINMRLLAKVGKRLAGGISFDEIIEIKRSNFSGHVYNLETEDGWYTASNIITHNCRPAEYWGHEFIIRGMTLDALLTMNLALLFSNIHSPLNYYADNLMVFTK